MICGRLEMTKTNILILCAGMICLLTACGSNFEENKTTTLMLNDNIISESTISEAAATLEITEKITEEATNIGLTVSPSGYVLDPERKIIPQHFGMDLEMDTAYFLWQSDDECQKIYGVLSSEIIEETDELGTHEHNRRYIIIEHDGIAEEIERNWLGRFGTESTPDFERLSQYDNDIFSSLYFAGGTFCCINDMALFSLDANGKYKMYSADSSKIIDELKNNIVIDIDKENKTVTLSTGTIGSMYVSDISYLSEYNNFDIDKLSSDNIWFAGDNVIYYYIEDAEIICKMPVWISYYNYLPNDENMPYLKIRLSFNDGEFTVKTIDFVTNPIL